MRNNDFIKQKFLKIDKDEYFIKIDDNDNIKISIGRMNEKFCFFVDGNTRRTKVNSTKEVQLLLDITNKKVKRLFFILNDESLLDVFINLIIDIQEFLEKGSSKAHIDQAYYRWSLWKKMFTSEKTNLLSSNSIQGLFGELYFLYNYMYDYYKIDESVFSWGGADYNKKDFEINDTWFEIKCIISGNASVKISSLEQLDSLKEGKLVVINVEKTTLVNDKGISINDLINKIVEKIDNHVVLDLFVEKLQHQGYIYSSYYDGFKFEVRDINFYQVDNTFPKVTKNNVPSEVIKCKYELDLVAIEKYKTFI